MESETIHQSVNF